MKIYRKALLGLCCMLSGCMLGPDYHPPENCIPERWISDPCCEECMSTDWWQVFNDPLLDRYIELAACYNNDILVAEATIFQARALRQMTASQLFPQINGNLNVSRTYFSKNGPVFDISTAETTNTPGFPFQIQVPQIQNIYTALIDTSWEIDLFGKTRRAVEAACANIGSAIEQRNAILLAVIADVARNYIDLRSAQQKGVLIEENISLLEDEAAIIQNRWRKGLDNRLDVKRIEAELLELKASLPPLCTEIYRSIYALSILTGALPETLLEELLPIEPLPEVPEGIACGLRSDLLRRRPDVRGAERDLAATTANIGVAVASFFPSFSFTTDLGLQSLNLRQLFRGRSTTWSIGGVSTMPIFQGGNLVGNLRLSEGQAAAAAFTYQQTVLTALEEAESALIAYTKEQETVCWLNQTVKQYKALDYLTAERFKKGIVSVTDVIDSGRQLNVAKQTLLDSETTLLLDLVTLYKALGGGWEVFYIDVAYLRP